MYDALFLSSFRAFPSSARHQGHVHQGASDCHAQFAHVAVTARAAADSGRDVADARRGRQQGGALGIGTLRYFNDGVKALVNLVGECSAIDFLRASQSCDNRSFLADSLSLCNSSQSSRKSKSSSSKDEDMFSLDE
jgi:hypothetical protein